MTSSPYDPPQTEPVLTIDDVYRAATEGVLARDDADRLVEWARTGAVRAARPVEAQKGLNLVTVAYYFGALLTISACGWFLADRWDALGSPGVFATVLVYAAVATGVGLWARALGFTVAGGLLVTVAVGLVPLLTYAAEDMLGVWPSEPANMNTPFAAWVPGSRIVMELATVAAAALALRYVRFAFLTAPMACALWLLSLDLAALAVRTNELDWDRGRLVSMGVGLAAVAIGFGLDRTLAARGRTRTEDFAFWCYLFGLAAAWIPLTTMNSDSEVGRALYAVLNLGLVGVGVWLRRATFLVFGVAGIYVYLGHLAYEIFKDSALFPLSLALLGLSVIFVTIWAQRRFRHGVAVAAH